MSTSPLWDIVQEWYDKQRPKPSWAKVAEELGVSQSTFDTWKSPAEMPRRRNLWAIHDLTGVPFKTVVDAAVESVGLYDPLRASLANMDYRKGKSDGRAQRRSQDEDAIGNQDQGGFDPA